MIKVVYVPSGNHAMALAGESLLERLHAAGAPVESVCKGNGVCGTCIVEVSSGAEHLSPAADEEKGMVARRGGSDRCRLSCQTTVLKGANGEVRLAQPVLRIARAESERARRALRRVDWDHAGSHPVDPGALQEMGPYLAGRYGSPGEGHFFAARARDAVAAARARIARVLGCARSQVLLLSGWNELSHGLSILYPGRDICGPAPLFFRPMEHLSAGRKLRAWKFLPGGRLDMVSVAKTFAARNAIAFFGPAIECVGTRLPMEEVAARASARRIPFVVDLSWVWPVDASWAGLAGSGALAVTVDPSLFGAPRGVLIAVLKPGKGWPIPEGAADPARAVGAAAAIERASAGRAEEGARLAELRDGIETFFQKSLSGCVAYETELPRLPQAACLQFRDWNADGLARFLETAGVALAGAARESRTDRILAALKADPAVTAGALSVWLGPENTREEFETARDRILSAVKSFRAVVPSARPGLMPGSQKPAPRAIAADAELRAAMMDEA